MTQEKVKSRELLFDNLKFIGIFLVVFAHIIESIDTPATNVLYKIIYLFHMPLFIFVSGYFAKFDLKKIVRKLVIPYAVTQFIWSVAEYFIVGSTQNFFLFIITPRWVLWYLFSMIIWRISTLLLEKLDKKFLPVVLVISVMIGLLLGLCNFDGYVLSISRTIVFYPFFILGFYFKRLNFKNWRIFKDNFFRLGFLAIAIMSIALFFALFPNLPQEALYNAYSYSQVQGYSVLVRLYTYFSATMIIFAFLMFANFKSQHCVFIGQNSMVIYLVHGLIVRGLEFILPKNLPLPIIYSIILTLLVIALCILIKKGWILLKTWLIELKKQQKF